MTGCPELLVLSLRTPWFCSWTPSPPLPSRFCRAASLCTHLLSSYHQSYWSLTCKHQVFPLPLSPAKIPLAPMEGPEYFRKCLGPSPSGWSEHTCAQSCAWLLLARVMGVNGIWAEAWSMLLAVVWPHELWDSHWEEDTFLLPFCLGLQFVVQPRPAHTRYDQTICFLF